MIPSFLRPEVFGYASIEIIRSPVVEVVIVPLPAGTPVQPVVEITLEPAPIPEDDAAGDACGPGCGYCGAGFSRSPFDVGWLCDACSERRQRWTAAYVVRMAASIRKAVV